MLFAVEHGEPIPPEELAATRPSKYPLAELGLGDGFFVPVTFASNNAARQAAKAAHGRFPGRRFATRKVCDHVTGAVLGVRVWRVE